MTNLAPWHLAMGQQATGTPAAGGTAAGVQELGDADFSRILSAPKAVVNFYAPTCPYSQKFDPIYKALASQNPDVLFAAVNVNQHTQQAKANKLQMTPTVVFFVNGKAVGRIDGVQDQADFVAEMGKAFGGAPTAAPAPTPAAPQAQAVPTSQRSGTLVDVEASGSPWPYIAGGVAAAGLLTAAYFLFIK